MTWKTYVKGHLETRNTLLVIGGIHIEGSKTKHISKVKQKQEVGEISIHDYIESCRKCTRKTITTISIGKIVIN